MGEFRVHHCRFFDYRPSSIHCLAYNEQNDKLAASRADGSIEIWNVTDAWYQEKIIPPRADLTVEALAWGPGNRLFSASINGYIHEHDIVTSQVKKSIPSNYGAVWCLSANEGKTKLAAGTEEGCIVILDISTAEMQYERAFNKQEGRILCLAWHEAENVIVTGSVDNLRIWSTLSGQAIQRLTLGRQSHNTETIVWAVAVTSDFTIVSGDSRGKTSFWHGKQGTLKKAFNTHKVDVLTVCASKDGQSVFAAGIDQTLVQFEYVPADEDNNWSKWIPTNLRHHHTHDVRALEIVKDYIVSGGVDSHIIYSSIAKAGLWRRIPPVPQSSLVSFARAADIVQLQYPKYLELWRLGGTEATSEREGVQLPIMKQPIKLLQLQSKGGRTIMNAAIANDASRVAYVDDRGCVRLYSVDVSEGDLPSVSVSKILPGTPILPSSHVCFSPRHPDTLVALSRDGQLQVLNMSEGEVAVTATLPNPTEDTSCHLVSICPRGKYVAVADHAHYVHVYSISKTPPKLICSLPRGSAAVTAMAFHPTQNLLAVMFADQKLFEFDVKQEEYSAWSRDFVRRMHPQWKNRRQPITHMFYHPQHTQQLFLNDEISFYVIDKTQDLPEPSQNLMKTKHAIHPCLKFKYMMHLDVSADDFLVVVERPPLAITETLPPPLKKKKFGH